MKNNLKIVCLQFGADGQGEAVGIFDRPFKFVKSELEKLSQNLGKIAGRQFQAQGDLTKGNDAIS